MAPDETPESDIASHCSPNYLLGALATDHAPIRLAVKVARGYAAALDNLSGTDLNEWTQATAKTCLSRGWEQAALAMLCTQSETQRAIYERRAENYLGRMPTRRSGGHG